MCLKKIRVRFFYLGIIVQMCILCDCMTTLGPPTVCDFWTNGKVDSSVTTFDWNALMKCLIRTLSLYSELGQSWLYLYSFFVSQRCQVERERLVLPGALACAFASQFSGVVLSVMWPDASRECLHPGLESSAPAQVLPAARTPELREFTRCSTHNNYCIFL